MRKRFDSSHDSSERTRSKNEDLAPDTVSPVHWSGPRVQVGEPWDGLDVHVHGAREAKQRIIGYVVVGAGAVIAVLLLSAITRGDQELQHDILELARSVVMCAVGWAVGSARADPKE
jgi:hypothetical protein